MKTLFAGRRGDQCITFRDQGCTDPPPPPWWPNAKWAWENPSEWENMNIPGSGHKRVAVSDLDLLCLPLSHKKDKQAYMG